MTVEPGYDFTWLHDPDVAAIAAPDPDEMAADRDRRDHKAWARAEEIEPPTLQAVEEMLELEPLPVTVEGIDLADGPYPEPIDCGTLQLSEFGGVVYITDLIIPGRIHVLAAEEGTGKTYAGWELGVRMATAGGSFAGTWKVEVGGPVVYLSEMHTDDDWRYQQDILDELGLDRSLLTGRLYRLDLGTAANGAPVLTDPAWRAQFAARCRRRGIRLAVFDTGTGATQVDPWGKSIQQVYRDLRVMLADCPELAVVLLLHLKKPQARGNRRISDVLGEWGRWCDVLVLMEADGAERTKVSTHKRIRHQKRIVATRRGGLLVEPQDITDAKPNQKVPPSAVLATIAANPGISRPDLAERLGVGRQTVTRYVKALGDDAVRVEPGTRKSPERYYPHKPPSGSVAHSGSREGEPPPEPRHEVGGGSVAHDPYRGVSPDEPPTSEAPVGDLTDAAVATFADLGGEWVP